MTDLQVSLADAKRVFEIFDIPKERLFKEKETKKLKTSYIINLKIISFSYSGNGEVLREVNMNLEKNKKYATVGPTGSGNRKRT